MSALFWTAVASICGVCILAITLIAHIIKWAEEKGHMRARIEALEKGQEAVNEAARVMPKLEAALEMLAKTVEKVDQTMNNLLQGRIQLPERSSRRRASAD